jgi:hypothetical protein
LPSAAYFGLITFSDRIGLYDLKSATPHILNLHIHPQPTNKVGAMIVPDQTKLGIQDVFPRSDFFVQVLLNCQIFLTNLQIEDNMNSINLAIESMRSSASDLTVKKRGFGSTIRSIVDYISEYSVFKHGKNVSEIP